jgi:nocturnin
MIFEIGQYSPDILCLQEVDRFYFIHKMLQKIGFDGKFVPKPDSPCYHLPENTGPDGCAIFYNTDRLVLLKTTSRVLQVNGLESNQVALLCTFQCRVSKRIFSVCTTHLKARKGSLLSLVRDQQGKDLLNFVESECRSKIPSTGDSKFSSNIPFIITGDFNAETSEPVYQTMTESLSSVYQDNLPPSYLAPSNWTRREDENFETKQTVDYIFYQRDAMTVTSVLDLYSPDLKNPLPNDQYPSDHLSLAAQFILH